MRLDRSNFTLQRSILNFGVVNPFGVDGWLKPIDQVDCIGTVADHNIVHAVQRPQGLGALLCGEDRPADAFPHMRVRRDADDQLIALCAGFLQMPDVAQVLKIPATVAKHDVDGVRGVHFRSRPINSLGNARYAAYDRAIAEIR